MLCGAAVWRREREGFAGREGKRGIGMAGQLTMLAFAGALSHAC